MSGSPSSWAKRISVIVGCIAIAYFAVPVIFLRFELDRLVFLKVDGGPTHEDRLIDVPVTADRSILIRQYGNSAHCVIFFPGQHGGIATYEHTLFPAIRQTGAAVYALSYPGHDGAKGQSHRTTILKDVAAGIAAIGGETSCQPNTAVFVGRSLGASIAIYTAQGTPPKGILLDGVGLTLTDAIYAVIKRHTLMRPWALLPLRRLVQDDSLIPVIRSLMTIPIVVFQGTNDQVTPFLETQTGLAHEDNVRFFAVNGATHSNAYVLAQNDYTRQLADLMAR